VSAIPITEKLLLNAGGWQAMKPARELLKGGRVSEAKNTSRGSCNGFAAGRADRVAKGALGSALGSRLNILTFCLVARVFASEGE